MRSNGRGIRKAFKRPEDALNNVLTLLDLNTTALNVFHKEVSFPTCEL